MTKATLVVLSNPMPGRENEYNDWYTNQHLGDVLAVPGIVAATRFKLRSKPAEGQAWRYCALYEIEHDDPGSVLEELNALSGTNRMLLSEAIDINGVHAAVYEPFVTRGDG